ncbi:hypothetical protein M747DRAFT_146187 [Aspergillus niger ATCC 13496]|uniref:Uncharacterized protein n=1 Tax=Aspergillus niger ATCC 13496 TaxID=1353008 RepID=A0A370BKU2_ASPNG|nr:hypothetical protein M747DRAFT_146187 [Aspergillus niger ATCC 13496]
MRPAIHDHMLAFHRRNTHPQLPSCVLTPLICLLCFFPIHHIYTSRVTEEGRSGIDTTAEPATTYLGKFTSSLLSTYRVVTSGVKAHPTCLRLRNDSL